MVVPVCTALFILGLVGGGTLLLIRGGALLLVFRPGKIIFFSMKREKQALNLLGISYRPFLPFTGRI